MNSVKVLVIAIITVVLSTCHSVADDNKKDVIQRTPAGTYDLQKNTLSNFDFYTTNYGINELDMENFMGGGYWARGSQNQYLFASGLWFGAMKFTPDKSTLRTYVEITYNPNSGKSWFVPGRIEDGDTLISDKYKKYRIYFSTDFNPVTGEPLNPEDGPNWPYWNVDSSTDSRDCFWSNNYVYVQDENKRNRANYPLGPSIISDEDIVSVYKDTDISKYEGGPINRKKQGYPLRLQVETRILTWKDEYRKDITIKLNKITNMSTDTLWEFWIGSINDIDIMKPPNIPYTGQNDMGDYFREDSTLNFNYYWTQTNNGEGGSGFGYMGISALETPVIDQELFVKNSKTLNNPEDQLGLITSRHWTIENDLQSDSDRYLKLSSGIIEANKGAGNERLLLATGPFNIYPYQTARFAVAYVFALPAKGGEADGTYQDLTGYPKSGNKIDATETSLIGKAQRIKRDYYWRPGSSVNEDNKVNNNTLSIYPNPAGNILNIQMINTNFNDKIRIYSLQGILMLEAPFSERIDISSMPVGMYYICVNNHVKSFIKL